MTDSKLPSTNHALHLNPSERYLKEETSKIGGIKENEEEVDKEEVNWAGVANRCQKIISKIRHHVCMGMVEGEHRRERRVARLLCSLGIIREETSPFKDSHKDESLTAQQKDDPFATVNASNTSIKRQTRCDANYLDTMMNHALRWCPFEIAAALLFVAGKTIIEGSEELQKCQHQHQQGSSKLNDGGDGSIRFFADLYPAMSGSPREEDIGRGLESNDDKEIKQQQRVGSSLSKSQVSKAVSQLVASLGDEDEEETEQVSEEGNGNNNNSNINNTNRALEYVSVVERRICREIFATLFLAGLEPNNNNDDASSHLSRELLFSYLPHLSTYASIGALYPILITKEGSSSSHVPSTITDPSSSLPASDAGGPLANRGLEGKIEENGGLYDENRSQNTIAESLLGGGGRGRRTTSLVDFSFLRPFLSAALTAMVRDKADGLLALIRVLLFDDRVHSSFTLDAVQHVSRLVTSRECAGGHEEGFRKICSQITVILKSYYDSRGDGDLGGENEEEKSSYSEEEKLTTETAAKGRTKDHQLNGAHQPAVVSSSAHTLKIVREAASRVQKKTLFGSAATTAGGNGLSDETLEERLHMTLVSILESLAKIPNITPSSASAPQTTASELQRTAATNASNVSKKTPTVQPVLSGFVLLNRCFLGPLFAPLTLRRATSNHTSRNEADNASPSARGDGDEVVGALRALWAITHGSSLILTASAANNGASTSSSSSSSTRRLICVVWGVVAKGVMKAYATLKSFEKNNFLLGIESLRNEKSPSTRHHSNAVSTRPLLAEVKKGPLIVELSGDEPKPNATITATTTTTTCGTSFFPSDSHSLSFPSDANVCPKRLQQRRLAHMTYLIERTLDTLLVTAHANALSPSAEEIILVLVGIMETSNAVPCDKDGFMWKIIEESREGENKKTEEQINTKDKGGQVNRAFLRLAAVPYKLVSKVTEDNRRGPNNSIMHLTRAPAHHQGEEDDLATPDCLSVSDVFLDFLSLYSRSASFWTTTEGKKSFSNGLFGKKKSSTASQIVINASRPSYFIHKLFINVVEAMAAQHALDKIKKEDGEHQTNNRLTGSNKMIRRRTSVDPSSLVDGLSPLTLLGVSLLSTYDVSVLMGSGGGTSPSSSSSFVALAKKDGVEKSIILILKFISLLCKMDEGDFSSSHVASSSSDLTQTGRKGQQEHYSSSSSSFLTLLVATALPQLLTTILEILDIVVLEPKTLLMMNELNSLQPNTTSSTPNKLGGGANIFDRVLRGNLPGSSSAQPLDGSNGNNMSMLPSATISKINNQIACLAELLQEARELLARFDASVKFPSSSDLAGHSPLHGVAAPDDSAASSPFSELQNTVTKALEDFIAQVEKLRSRLPADEIIDAADEDDERHRSDEEEGGESQVGVHEDETLGELKREFLRLTRAMNDAKQALMARSAPALAVNFRQILSLVKSIGGENFVGVDRAIADGCCSSSSSSFYSTSSLGSGEASSTLSTSNALNLDKHDHHGQKNSDKSSSSKMRGRFTNKRWVVAKVNRIPSAKDALAYSKVLKEVACLSLRALIAIHDGSASAAAATAGPSSTHSAASATHSVVAPLGGATCSTDLYVQSSAIQILAYLMIGRLDGCRGQWLASVLKRGLLLAVPQPPPPPPSSLSVSSSSSSASSLPTAPQTVASPFRMPNIYSNIQPAATNASLSATTTSALEFPLTITLGQRNAMALLILEALTVILDVDEGTVGGGVGSTGTGGLTIKLIDSTPPYGWEVDSKSNNNITLFDTLVLAATGNISSPSSHMNATSVTPLPSPSTSARANINNNSNVLNQSTQPHDRRITVSALQTLGRVFICLHPRLPLTTLLGVCTDIFRAPNMTMMARAAVSASVTYVSIFMLVVGLGAPSSSSSATLGTIKTSSSITNEEDDDDNGQKVRDVKAMTRLLTSSSSSQSVHGGGTSSSSSSSAGDELVQLSRFAQNLIAYAPRLSSGASHYKNIEGKKEGTSTTVAFDDPDWVHVEVIRSHGQLIQKALNSFREYLADRVKQQQQTQIGVSGLESDIQLLRKMESEESSMVMPLSSSSSVVATNITAGGGGSSTRQPITSGGASSSSAGALRVVAQHLLSNARTKARRDLTNLSSFTQDLQAIGEKKIRNS